MEWICRRRCVYAHLVLVLLAKLLLTHLKIALDGKQGLEHFLVTAFHHMQHMHRFASVAQATAAPKAAKANTDTSANANTNANSNSNPSSQGNANPQQGSSSTGDTDQPAAPKEAWYLPPATAFANGAYNQPMPPYYQPYSPVAPPYRPMQGYPYAAPYGPSSPFPYGLYPYGYYYTHPASLRQGGGPGYHNMYVAEVRGRSLVNSHAFMLLLCRYGYYPGVMSYPHAAGHARFAQADLDKAPPSDAHAAAAEAGYQASHWKDFAPRSEAANAEDVGFVSAYRPAQRAAMQKHPQTHSKEAAHADVAELHDIASKLSKKIST